MSKPRSFRQVLDDIVRLANSDPYYSSDAEYVEVNIGKFCDELVTLDTPAHTLPRHVARLRPLRNRFSRIGGPYASLIAGHLSRAITVLEGRCRLLGTGTQLVGAGT